MPELHYTNNCVNWPKHDVEADGGLCDMVDKAVEVTRKTFLQHVNRVDLRNLERSLGYVDHPTQGMTMAGDYHVSYSRSKLHGETVYFMPHSAVEYVFTNTQSH
jgi:hypothetical protein